MAADVAVPAKPHVLVVDDYADAAELLAEALSFAGYPVSTAGDGLAALEAFEGKGDAAPAAAFIDIGMPGMNGYEVAGALRKLPGGSALYLVALTGHSGEAERRRSVEAGFDLHLVKPVDLAEVAQLLEQRFKS
ncbi:MAG TPA: response regulator [Polyangiaceae bacterium]|jgi:CheY-like chemotaxis protein|nr:response regulator [Polyangiaceae bacterium]